MVFVWSYLTDGDPAYTLVQVSVNNLIMLVLFAPIVGLLVSGASSLSVPFDVLLYSVLAFIVIPLAIGWGLRAWLVRQKGQRWVEDMLLPRFAPVTIVALLLTLVFIFAFQAQNIMGKTVHVVLIAVPILLQVYVNASLAYGLMHRFRVSHAIAAPDALIGASNFFEWAVATAIALFGAESGAALATVWGYWWRCRSCCRSVGSAIGPGIGSRVRRLHETVSLIPLHRQLGSESNDGRMVAAFGGRSL
jgi:ACR3 family arsenite transporter